jgi:hypothetical protein
LVLRPPGTAAVVFVGSGLIAISRSRAVNRKAALGGYA